LHAPFDYEAQLSPRAADRNRYERLKDRTFHFLKLILQGVTDDPGQRSE
jgi:hypothetical protein